MILKPPFTPLVRALPDVTPFVGPETLERRLGQTFKARVGANESAFGISPKAHDAIVESIGIEGCSWYGDPENYDVKVRLCAKHNVDESNICVDAGIDSILGLTIRMFVSPGDTVVTSVGAYPTVNYHVNGFGGVIKAVPYKNHCEDPMALAAAAKEHKAKLVYLANPDNPMGTSVTAESIQTLVDELPTGCVLMLDEAYIEFMSSETPLPLDISVPNLIRYRTFSKAYGMAGMRIGYALAHADVIAGFNKIRNHFGVNKLAQLAASASLDDSTFLPSVLDRVQRSRTDVYTLAQSLGLGYLNSDTNFVAVDLSTAEHANQIVASLQQAGIFMRKPMAAPQDTYIRIGLGTQEEFSLVSSTLKQLVGQG